jgi:CRP-like cAMP-binding protein
MKSIPVSNRLLAVLPRQDRRRLLASCEQVQLSFAEVVYEPGDIIKHVYFPLNSFLSLLIPIEGRASLEVELVGNEGMFGVPLVLGVNVSPLQGLVQGSGDMLRMRARVFHSELSSSPALQRILHRYIHVLMAQLAQSAACLSFHSLDSRLARWLLMTHDRAHSNDFYLTHEFLSKMLGVRRVGVTNAAGSLQRRKLVRYSRGNVTIINRAGLEAVSCKCYGTARDTYERHLS